MSRLADYVAGNDDPPISLNSDGHLAQLTATKQTAGVNKVAGVIWRELQPYSPVFSTAEVAQRAGIALSNASRDLAELARDGMITRIRRGVWAVPHHPDFSQYAVVPHLFAEQGREFRHRYA